MGRNSKALFRDPVSKIYFARWYEGEKKIRLSLNTTDETEAYKRHPVVLQTKMSWNKYYKSMQGMNSLVVNQLAGHQITPGLTIPTQQDALQSIISSAVSKGQASWDQQRKYWLIKALSNTPTDSTAMPSMPLLTAMPDDEALFLGLDSLRSAVIINQWDDIWEFYTVSMLLSYKDKDRALRFGEIWLQFLEKNGIKSWNQITEKLVVDDFKVWRKNTPIPRGTGNKTLGQPPSNAVVNQHMQYLFKSFNKAVSQRKMISNPIFEIIPEKHIKKEQDVLTFDEFEKVIALLNGSVLQIVLLLFCSCKRRKEIVLLQIEDIDYKNHYVHYTEWKNSEKIRLRIEKAFHITQAMELFFKRIVGNRTSGPIWSDVTPEYVSSKYEDAVEQIVPKKKTTLKTIRQLCTEVMTEAGLSKEEKDFTLHNTVTERFYENQAAHAVYKRLAERSKKGIEVLSKTAEEYL